MSLGKIQAALKAPKSQFNQFGGYNYRSTEDILEAIKPLLVEYDGYINISDEVRKLAGRIFVEANVKLVLNHDDMKEVYEASATAEQSTMQKGMNTPQLTLSASSFARKQALQGLFAIDDSSQAYTEEKVQDVVVFDANAVKNLLKETGSDLKHFYAYFKQKKIEDFSKAELAKAGVMLTKKLEQANETESK